MISELGTGGMATVYFGRAYAAAGFQRLVAVKYLHPHLLKDAEFVRMFLDEGRLAAQIRHPNVVSVLDLEHTSEGLYLVMEYVEGDQLLGLFKGARALKKRIPFGITLRIGLDVLAGLHAAHELTDDMGSPLKIVHRDISPHNILVGSDGIGRITDFGIAKAEERIATTRDGIVKGKLSYMAPEAPNGMPLDRRADLFSTATVIWECLTGRRLFPGKTDAEVLKNLLQNPIPRLREVDPALPDALDDVLARALDRNPDARYGTAAEFAEAIESAGGALGIASPRAVSQYVREMAGQKIGDEHRQRRATATRDVPVFRPSVPPPVDGASSGVTPSSMPGEDAATVVRHPLPSGIHRVPSTPPVVPAPADAHAPSYPTNLPTMAPPVPEPRSSAHAGVVLLFTLVVLAGIATGSAVWYVWQRPRPVAAAPRAPSAPTTTTVARPEPPSTPVALPSTPAPEITIEAPGEVPGESPTTPAVAARPVARPSNTAARPPVARPAARPSAEPTTPSPTTPPPPPTPPTQSGSSGLPTAI